MLLYHGTKSGYQSDILAEGIKPRSMTDNSNWTKHPSRTDFVYLTLAYAAYFAVCAIGEGSDFPVIFEIDKDVLDESRLFPDEDFISQMLAQGTGAPLSEVHLVAHKKILKYQEFWDTALQGLGNIGYRGIVPPKAITRYAIIDSKMNPSVWYTSLDPLISILNFKFKGEYYKQFIAWIFGDTEHPEVTVMQQFPEDFRQQLEKMKEISVKREGITVHKVNGR